MIKFHFLVRGVYISKGKILLARSKGEKNTFLPGGHIELGERAETALIREIGEEINRPIEIHEFIGAVEHTWPEIESNNHEINLVFRISINGLSSVSDPISHEDHLEFAWATPEELVGLNLQPAPMIELIEYIDLPNKPFWGSTI